MSGSSHAKSKTPLLGDGTYNVLKKSTTLVLPAAGTLYFGLAQIWGLPNAEEVIGTIAAVNTFLGVLLGISTKSYDNSMVQFDGTIKVDKMTQRASIELHHGSEEELTNKPVALFKIENEE